MVVTRPVVYHNGKRAAEAARFHHRSLDEAAVCGCAGPLHDRRSVMTRLTQSTRERTPIR